MLLHFLMKNEAFFFFFLNHIFVPFPYKSAFIRLQLKKFYLSIWDFSLSTVKENKS